MITYSAHLLTTTMQSDGTHAVGYWRGARFHVVEGGFGTESEASDAWRRLIEVAA